MKGFINSIVEGLIERRDNAVATHAFNLGFLGYENTLHHSLFVLEIEFLNAVISLLNTLK